MNFVYVRDKSDDRSIWTSVVNDDEYRIGSLAPEDIVLDIGMHTGSFCARAYLAGSRRIYGFEVDEDNFRLAQANVGAFAQLHNYAVVRSDERKTDIVYYTGHVLMEHELNTGVGTVFGSAGRCVDRIAFDDILMQIGDEVRLVKMDCEGSEWPILMTATRLHRVHEIVGEWHLNHLDKEEALELPFPMTLEQLACTLAEDAFTTRFYARAEDMPNPIVGYFRAVNTKWRGWEPEDPWVIGVGRERVAWK